MVTVGCFLMANGGRKRATGKKVASCRRCASRIVADAVPESAFLRMPYQFEIPRLFAEWYQA